MEGAIVKSNQPLATALHGWGNQLHGCPCGCRKQSMDHSRLQAKGLFGALIVMEGQLECVAGPRNSLQTHTPMGTQCINGMPPQQAVAITIAPSIMWFGTDGISHTVMLDICPI